MRRILSCLFLVASVSAAQQPLFRVLDLAVGATEQVTLSDGKTATVKLLSTSETRDRVRSAIRDARVEVEINGTRTTLSCGNYRLPVAVGRSAGRLRNHQSLLWRHAGRLLGAHQRRPPALVARRVAVHAGKRRSSIRSGSAGSLRARKWLTSRLMWMATRKSAQGGFTTTRASILGAPKGWWMFSRRPAVSWWESAKPCSRARKKVRNLDHQLQRHHLGA